MDDENPIDKALNLTPSIDFERTISTIVSSALNDSAKEDFTFARANIREVLENGNDAITKLSIIADQSQNPRAFEVLAKLMDSIVEANNQLLELQKEIRTIERADDPHNDHARTVTNNLFVGSTTQLQKMIEEMNDKKISL